MQGLAFGDVFPRFPNAIVLGVSNVRSGYTRINPPGSLRLEAGDALVRACACTWEETLLSPIFTCSADLHSALACERQRQKVRHLPSESCLTVAIYAICCIHMRMCPLKIPAYRHLSFAVT